MKIMKILDVRPKYLEYDNHMVLATMVRSGMVAHESHFLYIYYLQRKKLYFFSIKLKKLI